MMMRAVNRAFQLRPEAFNGVRVATPTNVFLASVVDGFVAVAKRLDVVVMVRLIGVDRSAQFNRVADVANDTGSVDRADNLGLNIVRGGAQTVMDTQPLQKLPVVTITPKPSKSA